MMVGLALREFTCSLCGQSFEKYSGDLIIPSPELCHVCLGEVWSLDDLTLKEYVRTAIQKQNSSLTVKQVVQYIHQQKSQWSSAEEAIRARKLSF